MLFKSLSDIWIMCCSYLLMENARNVFKQNEWTENWVSSNLLDQLYDLILIKLPCIELIACGVLPLLAMDWRDALFGKLEGKLPRDKESTFPLATETLGGDWRFGLLFPNWPPAIASAFPTKFCFPCNAVHKFNIATIIRITKLVKQCWNLRATETSKFIQTISKFQM